MEVQGLYPFGELMRKLDRQNGLIFDVPEVLRKMYVEEIEKSMIEDDSYKPQFNLKLSNILSKNILQMAHNIGSLTMQQIDQNYIVFSPLSIATALALLLLGSNGRTNDELMQLFGVDRNSIFHRNRKEIHNQFGYLIEDLLRNTQHPQRIRPVEEWKFKTSNMDQTRFSDYFGKQHKIEVANGIFVQKGFSLKLNYQSTAEKIYRGEIRTVDFQGNGEATRKLINDWAEKKTNGRIHEILAEGIPAKTNMILASTLYFKALWENSFFKKVTSKRHFYSNGRRAEAVLVDMMFTNGEFPYYDAEEYECRILGLPYKGNQTTMYIILPYDSNKLKLQKLQKFLTAEKIEELIAKLKMTSAFVSLPKMHLESYLNLKDILKQLGVHSIFNSIESDLSLIADGFKDEKSLVISRLRNRNNNDNNNNSKEKPFIFNRFGDYDDFENNSEEDQRENYKIQKDSFPSKRVTLMENRYPSSRSRKIRDIRNHQQRGLSQQFQKVLSNPRIFVDDVLHKADLTIDENGTEGAAVTTTLVGRSGLDTDFQVDSPFLFLIRHDATKLPLFYGSVYNPVT